jgi:hypothetical protein
LATLDKIDYLLSVPKQLDNFLRRRQYLHAVSLLSASIESLVDPELQGSSVLVKQNCFQSFQR